MTDLFDTSQFAKACSNNNMKLAIRLAKTDALVQMYDSELFGQCTSQCASQQQHDDAETNDAADTTNVNLVVPVGKESIFCELAFLFETVCDHGNLEFAQWFADRFQFRRMRFADSRRQEHFHSSVFCCSCRGKNLKLVQWLVDLFGLEKEDVLRSNKNALRHACQWNRLDILQWLLVHFGLNMYFDDLRFRLEMCQSVSMRCDNLFSMACIHGHFEIAEWIAQTFRVTANDVCGDGTVSEYSTFIKICCSHDEPEIMIRWLVERFNLTSEKVVGHENSHEQINHRTAFSIALEHGHLKTARFLAERFYPKGANALSRSVLTECLKTCCRLGSVEMLDWIVHRFEVTTEIIRERDNAVLRIACAKKMFEIASWLVERFGLTAADVNCANSSMIQSSFLWDTDDNTMMLIKWLLHHFPEEELHIPKQFSEEFCAMRNKIREDEQDAQQAQQRQQQGAVRNKHDEEDDDDRDDNLADDDEDMIEVRQEIIKRTIRSKRPPSSGNP